MTRASDASSWTCGLTLEAAVHPANIQDRDGANLAIEKMVGRFPSWPDMGGCRMRGEAGGLGERSCGLRAREREALEGRARIRGSSRRRAVERTPAWLGKYRRMSEGCERLAETSDAWIRHGDDLPHAKAAGDVN